MTTISVGGRSYQAERTDVGWRIVVTDADGKPRTLTVRRSTSNGGRTMSWRAHEGPRGYFKLGRTPAQALANALAKIRTPTQKRGFLS